MVITPSELYLDSHDLKSMDERIMDFDFLS